MKKFIKLLFIALLGLNALFCNAQQRGDTLIIHQNKRGTISFLRFKPNSTRKIANAKPFLNKVLHAKPDDEFRLIRQTKDKLGITTLRFQQYYKGIKVENMEYLVHGKNGIIETINGDFEHVDIPSVTSSISEQQALKKALNSANAKEYKWESKNYEKFLKQRTNNPDTTYYPTGELVIVRDYLKTGYNLKLAWKFIVSTLIPNDELLIFIDANTGKVISKRSLILDANTLGTAETMYSGTQGITSDSYSGSYRLRETRNGVNIQTMNMQGGYNITNAIDFTNSNTNWIVGSWPNITSDQQALDAHWGAEKVLDYWRTVFDRNSLNGNGLQILGYVHFYQPNTSQGWPNNAAWDPRNEVMKYGDGDGIFFRPLTALDVVAHEMGHGINEFTANLGSPNYNQESDALNEGFSDIWGASVEHWAAPEKQTWLIGEDIIFPPYTCLRDLQNPPDTLALEGKHPDSYHDQYWSYSGEPHTNSTVLSHWFYLLSIGKDGGTNDLGTAYFVKGIGIDEAQQIAFRGEKNLFPSATYADARNAMINAAINLYGTNSCELVNVTNAWYAVGVGSPFHYSNVFITGPQTVSTTNTTFTFSNCSHVSSISWTHSNDLVYESGQGTNNYTVQALSCSESEMGWVQAIVNSGYGNDTLKKNVWVGVPATPTIICPYTIVGLNSLIEVNAAGPGAESYNWSVGGGTITSGQGTSDIWIMTSSHCQNDLTIRLTTSNACGSSAQAIKSIPFDCSGGITPLSVSPNPADNILTVEINNNKTPDNLNNSNFKTSELRVYDKMMNLKMKKTFKGTKIQINVRNLKQGVYILQIISGNKNYKKEIMVSHH